MSTPPRGYFPFVRRLMRGATSNQMGDWSGAEAHFDLTPSSGDILIVERILIHIVFNATGLLATNYGTAAALANGVKLRWVDVSGASPVILEEWFPEAVVNNTDWGSYCYDNNREEWGVLGLGDDVIAARFSFNRFSRGFWLDGPDRILRCTLNDDLRTITRGIVTQRMTAEGNIAREAS